MFFLWILLRFFLSNYALPTLSSLEISTHSSRQSHQPSCCGAFRPLLGLFLPMQVPSHFLGQFCPSSLCHDRADLQQDPIYSPSGPFSLTWWYPQSWEPHFEQLAVGTICCCNCFASKKGCVAIVSRVWRLGPCCYRCRQRCCSPCSAAPRASSCRPGRVSRGMGSRTD